MSATNLIYGIEWEGGGAKFALKNNFTDQKNREKAKPNRKVGTENHGSLGDSRVALNYLFHRFEKKAGPLQ